MGKLSARLAYGFITKKQCSIGVAVFSLGFGWTCVDAEIDYGLDGWVGFVFFCEMCRVLLDYMSTLDLKTPCFCPASSLVQEQFFYLCPLRCGALLLNFPPPPRRLKMHASDMTNPPYQYFWFFTIAAKSKEYGTILYSFRLPFLCCCGTTFVLKLGRVSWMPYPSLQDFVLGEKTVCDGSTGGQPAWIQNDTTAVASDSDENQSETHTRNIQKTHARKKNMAISDICPAWRRKTCHFFSLWCLINAVPVINRTLPYGNCIS